MQGGPEGVAEAFGVDGAPRRRVIGGDGAVQVQAKDLAPQVAVVLGRGGVEPVTHINIELAIGADGEGMRLMGCTRRDAIDNHLLPDSRHTIHRALQSQDPVLELAGVFVDEADEDILADRVDGDAGDTGFAGSWKLSGGVEVKQVLRVRGNRAVLGYHLDLAVQLGCVDEGGVGAAASVGSQRQVHRQSEPSGEELDAQPGPNFP